MRWGVLMGLALAVAACRPVKRDYAKCPATYGEVNEAEVGAVAGGSSALRDTELHVSGDVAAVLEGPYETSVLSVGEVVLRYSRGWFTGFVAGAAGAYALHLPPMVDDGAVLEGTAQRERASGNLRGGVAWRYFYTRVHDTYRRAWAVRLDYARGGAEHSDFEILSRRPFDLLRFAPGQTGQLTIEARYELVGCFAPYVHVQAGVAATRRDDVDTVMLPMSIAAGARSSEAVTFYAELAALAGEPPDRGAASLFARYRMGVDLDFAHDWGVRPGLVFDINLGALDGVFFGVELSIPLSRGE